jgi:hypothetical protein
MGKQRIHNEWFQDTCYGVCSCGSNKRSRRKGGVDSVVYAWGEYHNGKWRTIRYVCEACFQSVVIPRLVSHVGGCGCSFVLAPRSGHSLAPWITLSGSVLDKVA